MQKSLSISTRLLYEELSKQRIITSIINNQLLELKIKNKLIYLKGTKNSLQSSVGSSIAQNKNLSKIILHRYNIPTAKHVVVEKRKQLKKIKRLQFPIVMKPIDGAHGKGVVVGIKSYSKSRTFFIQSQMQNKKTMIFEETLLGNEFRILCIDHKFVAATLRKPAFITGDGKKTIEELIHEKNQHPWRSDDHTTPLSKIMIDDLLNYDLAEKGLSYISIPKKGEEIQLRKTSNISNGGEPENVTAQVCKENKNLFEKISVVCDLNIIGLDVMCQTLSKPLIEQDGAGIVEINASPGLRIHHYPLKGKPINVASKIIEMIIKYI